MKLLKTPMSWLEKNGLWGLVITVLIIGVVCTSYYYEKQYEARTRPGEFGYYSKLEFPLIDLRQRLLFRPWNAEDEIVVVTITETALDRYKDRFGRWPWPRSVIAEIVKFLRHADSVSLDIGFMEPGGTEVSPGEAGKLREMLESAVRLAGTDPLQSQQYFQFLDRRFQQFSVSGDRELGRSLRQFGPAITTTWSLEFDGDRVPAPQTEKPLQSLSDFVYRIRGKRSVFPEERYVIPPIEPVLTNSYGLAHIQFSPDSDGPVRRFIPFLRIRSSTENTTGTTNSYLPILGLAGALEEWEITPGNADFEVTSNRLTIGDVEVPLDEKGRVLIRYKGGLRTKESRYRTYTEVPVQDIIGETLDQAETGTLSPEYFEGKKVLVGSTASGAHDLRATPFTAQEAGVAIHANILDMFLNKDFLRPIRTTHTLLLIALWTLAVGVVATFLSPVFGLILTVLLTTLLMVMALGLFNQGILINVSAPLVSSYLTYGLVTVYNLNFERRKRGEIRTAFESYLTTSVLDEVLKEPNSLRLGGERRRITVMFADISGFTSYSEGRTATEVASVVSDVMTELTACVFKYEGVLDKYIGDELVAEFGIVPGEPPGHAKRAVRSAVDMIDRLEDLKDHWREHNQEVLDLRIGIHTGIAVTGNMGSEMLFDYTAIGDSVNIGSRLEGANKVYGTRTLISESTYRDVNLIAEARKLDKIIVKGRKQPIGIYELLGLKGNVDQRKLQLRDRFERGLELYNHRRWKEAIEVFRNLTKNFEDDTPSKVFFERAKAYRKNPPSSDWDGEFRLSRK